MAAAAKNENGYLSRDYRKGFELPKIAQNWLIAVAGFFPIAQRRTGNDRLEVPTTLPAY